jgi:hypothetical protein
MTAPYHLSVGRFRDDNSGVIFVSAPGQVQAWCDGQAIALDGKDGTYSGSFHVPPEIDTAAFAIAVDGALSTFNCHWSDWLKPRPQPQPAAKPKSRGRPRKQAQPLA